MSLRDQILAVDDRKKEALEIPEWGCTVYVRSLSVKERGSFESIFQENAKAEDKNKALQETMTRVVIAAIVDETGAPIFTEADLDALAEKNAAVVGRIFNAAIRLNKIATGAVEEAKGN